MPKLVLFCHSLRSDWNHGNAHFLRGILAEWAAGLLGGGREPSDAWSARNLAAEHGETALDAWREAYPDLPVTVYDPAALDLDQALDGAALVIVHEWSAPDLVARIAAHRRASGRYLLLFHDTHHRMATDPEAIARFDLRRVRRRAGFRRGAVGGLSPPLRGTADSHGTRRRTIASSVRPGNPARARSRLDRQLGRRGAHDGIVRVSGRAGQGSRPVGPGVRRALPSGGSSRARCRRHRYAGYLGAERFEAFRDRFRGDVIHQAAADDQQQRPISANFDITRTSSTANAGLAARACHSATTIMK